MRRLKLVVSIALGVGFAVYMETQPGFPVGPGVLAGVLGRIVAFPLIALGAMIGIYIGLSFLPVMFGGPGRPPRQPTRSRRSLPYNSSNDPPWR